MFILGRINGVDRPALASILPTLRKPVVLIDVGANADCKPYNLVQFGLMAGFWPGMFWASLAPRSEF